MLLNIEAERVRNGMSKEDLATELGISLRTYYNWINQLTAIPSTALKKMSALRNNIFRSRVFVDFFCPLSGRNLCVAPSRPVKIISLAWLNVVRSGTAEFR